MNTTTKVFIVINLVLTLGLAYMAMYSYAYDEHWKRRWHKDTRKLAEQLLAVKDKVADHSFQRTRAEQATERLKADLNDAQSDIKLKTEAITRLETEKSALTTSISEKEDAIAAKEKQIGSLQESLEIARKRMKELNDIAQVSRAVAFQLSVKLAEVEDDLNSANTDKDRLAVTIKNLEETGKRKDAYLALVQEKYRDVWQAITSDQVQPSIVVRAQVAAICNNPANQQDLVMLTVGKDDSVAVGQEFIIYRGNQYIVKVRAERQLDDMVACRVIADTWNTKGEQIKQGDSAQNRMF